MIMNILYKLGFYKGFLHDVNSCVAKYGQLISQKQIHLVEIHIFTLFYIEKKIQVNYFWQTAGIVIN